MRRLVALIVCAFPFVALAAKSSGKKQPAPPADAVPAAKDPFAWPEAADLSLPAVLSHFERMDRELSTLKARFTQSLTMAETGLTQSSEGVVTYRKPDALRIEHLAPQRQTVVCDGKEIWIWRPAYNQVVQSSLDEWRKADPALNNLMQFGSYSQMLKSYDVQLQTAPVTALVLRPKTKPGGFELRLRLARANLFPEATELVAERVRVRTELSDIELNRPMDPKLFDFKPPEGADVFRDFKPPQLLP